MKTIRVAIAYDGSLFCEGLRELLRKEQDIDVAAVSEDGTEITRTLPGDVDVLILDHSFFTEEEVPKVVHTLKAKISGLKILMFLEGHEPDDLLMHYLMLGVDGYVKGSMTALRLVEAIRSVYAGTLWAERKLLSRFVMHPLLPVSELREIASRTDDPLTKREREIISLLMHGLSNRVLSERLHISETTVKTHLNNIYKKMKVNNRTQLVTTVIHSQ